MVHQASIKGCRVLVIEDEYFLGDDLASRLRLLGAHVIGPIPEVADAMAIPNGNYDVAVLDINLRGGSIYPLVDELTRLKKPFIFTTGYGADAIPDRFRDVRRLEKPCQLDSVIEAVGEMCSPLHPSEAA